MNCPAWEERIALYAGGDLPAEEAAGVERHLAECAGCQVFVSGLRQALDSLREAHSDVPSDAAFAAVRARVMDRVVRRRRFAWEYGLAGAAALTVLVLAVWVDGRPLPPPPVAALSVPAPPVDAFVIPKPVMPAFRSVAVSKPSKRVLHPVARVRSEPVLMKLITNDPDVVIYWIADSKGD